MIVLLCVIIAVFSYLLGSLNFGVLISRKEIKDDVRDHGSGNAGATNMLRNYGKRYATLTIIGDIAKVFVAIALTFAVLKLTGYYSSVNEFATGYNIDTDMLIKSFSGLFCVLGHIFPCYFGFKGGKGVATAGGMVIAIDWRIALILLVIFFIIILTTKYVSLGSIAMAVFYPVFIFIFYRSAVLTVIAALFMAIVVIAHRENIYKLIHHTESKIGLGKKKGAENDGQTGNGQKGDADDSEPEKGK